MYGACAAAVIGLGGFAKSLPLVEGRGLGARLPLELVLDDDQGFVVENRVAAFRADVGRHAVEDERPLPVDHRVADGPGLMLADAIWGMAFHVGLSSCFPPSRTVPTGGLIPDEERDGPGADPSPG